MLEGIIRINEKRKRAPRVSALAACVAVAAVAFAMAIAPGVATLSEANDQQSSQAAAAHWEGRIVTESGDLDLTIDMARSSNGLWLCRVSIPASGFTDRSMQCTVYGRAVTLRRNGTEFLGTISDDGASISGMLAQGTETLDFTVSRSGTPQFSQADLQASEESALAFDTPHTIPIKVERKGPVVLVSVEALINGHGPYELLLDTDNEFTGGVMQLDQGLIARLNLPVTTDDESEHATVSSMTLAGYDLPAITAESAAMAEIMLGPDAFDGILPLALLGNHTVTLDLARRSLTLSEDRLDANVEGVFSTSAGKNGEPLVLASLAGRPFLAALNLSSRSHVNLPIAYQDSVTLLSEPATIGRLKSDVGEFDVLAARFGGTLQIGSQHIPVKNLRFSEGFVRPEIGYPAFILFATTLDQQNGRASLVPSAYAVDVYEQAVTVKSLTDGKPRLRDAFNATPEKVRLILILAPT